jgi:DNA-binding transcriptional LysR family regulator
MYRPEQLDIVTRHIGDLSMGIYAARSYLKRVGQPQSPGDIRAFDLVGFDSNDLIIHTMNAMGWAVTRDDFTVRCDNQTTYWELVRAGCGIGFSQTSIGRDDPDIEELDFGVVIPPLPVWLAAHEIMRQTPRIRRVWDLLADGLKRAVAAQDPARGSG